MATALGSLSTKQIRALDRSNPPAFKGKLGTRLNKVWTAGNFFYLPVQMGTITAGTVKVCMVIPIDCKIQTIRALLKTGGTGTSVVLTTVDVNIDNVSILSTPITLAVASGYSRQLASLNSTKQALSANSVLSVDVDSIPDGTGPTDLSLSIVIGPTEA